MWEVQRHRLYSTGREGGLPDRCLKIPRHQRRAGVSPVVCHRIVRVLGSPSAARRIKRRRVSIDGHSKKSKCRTFVSSSSPRLSSRWVAPGSRRATKDPPSKTLVRNCARFALCRTARPAFTPPYSFKYVQLFVFNGRRNRGETAFRCPYRHRHLVLSRSPSLTPKLLARQARTASTTSRW